MTWFSAHARINVWDIFATADSLDMESASVTFDDSLRSIEEQSDNDNCGYDISDEESEGEEEELCLEPYRFEPVTVVDGPAHNSSSEDSENDDRPFLEDEERLANTNWYVSVVVVVVCSTCCLSAFLVFGMRVYRCSCGNCKLMPTIQESICCRTIEEVDRKRTDIEDTTLHCITEHPGFKSICLDRWVLETTGLEVNQHYGSTQETNGPPHKYVGSESLESSHCFKVPDRPLVMYIMYLLVGHCDTLHIDSS